MKKLYFFYKIICLNPKVTESYIGSTINFRARWTKHKSVCYKENCPAYKFKLYKFIRKNGGWSNWIMFPFDVLETDDYVAVRKKEKELIIINNSQLNTYNAYFDKKEYYDANKEKKRKYDKEYCLKNKNKIKLKQSKKTNCDCGGKFTYAKKSRHLKSGKHQKYLCQAIDQFKTLN